MALKFTHDMPKRDEKQKAEILPEEAKRLGEQDEASQVRVALKKVDRRLLPTLTLLYLLSFLDRGNGAYVSQVESSIC
jgi:hypothetical protein